MRPERSDPETDIDKVHKLLFTSARKCQCVNKATNEMIRKATMSYKAIVPTVRTKVIFGTICSKVTVV